MTREQLIKKFGSAEAVSDYYRQMQKKSRENYKGTGGFYANKKKASEAGKLGNKIRWGKLNKSSEGIDDSKDRQEQES
jgi:hypothetical protein